MKIKTTRPFSLAVASVGLFGSSALSSAQMIAWEDFHSGSPLDFLYESSSSDRSSDLTYAATWNLLNKGYTANSPITGITVWFKFADDSPGNFDGAESSQGGDVEEYIDLALGSSKIWDNLEVDGRHPSATYASYSMMLDPISQATIFSDLMADGKLSYSVELQAMAKSSFGREDTYLKEAGIRATFEAKPKLTKAPHQVPDGGTSLVLLGMSLVGIAGLRLHAGKPGQVRA